MKMLLKKEKKPLWMMSETLSKQEWRKTNNEADLNLIS